MGEVVPFVKPNEKSQKDQKNSQKKERKLEKKEKLSQKHKGNTLCKNGFHKWAIEKENTFDVKFGKLVTSYRCKRCNATKNTAQ